MATLTEWPLPLNPPQNIPAFLQYLTPVLGSRLYYTKYIVDYIGELNVRKDKDNVREWKIPAALSAGPSGNACGISYSPDGKRVWFALEDGCRLVELNPATGLFTAYGRPRLSGVRAQYSKLPIDIPRHIMFDRTGALWYTGSGRTGALIGRLAANRASATVWELPRELTEPEGIWVEESGREVWFTSIDSPYQTGAFLARLERTSGRLTTWSHPLARRPKNPGVAAEPRAKPVNVWFSHDQTNSESRVFRLHLPTGEVFEYPPVSGSPRKIAIDQDGNAWISDWGRRVSRIAKNATCMLIQLPKLSRTIRSKRHTVQAVSEEASPVVTSSVPTSQPVNPQVDGCYLHFPHPSSQSVPNGIALVDRSRGPDVYFSDSNLNRICLLQP